jgi:Zn-dependent protease
MTFRIGNIPIRVLPSFFFMAAVLGMLQPGIEIVAWVAVVLVSVIVHELGHAMVGRAFGLEPSVVLHGTGGTTSWTGTRQLSPAQRIAISLAGPGAGFVLGGLVWVADKVARSQSHSTGDGSFLDLGPYLVATLLFVNFNWGLINLLPMLPLDGGNVMAQTLNAVLKGRGERPARVISIVLAVAAVAVSVAGRSYWPAFLAVSFVTVNWRALKDLAAAEHDAPLRASLQGAYAALDAKDVARVLALAKPVALKSQTALVRAEALHLLAFGFLLDDRLADADAAIAAMPKGFSPNQALVDLRQAVARQGAK